MDGKIGAPVFASHSERERERNRKSPRGRLTGHVFGLDLGQVGMERADLRIRILERGQRPVRSPLFPMTDSTSTDCLARGEEMISRV